MAGAGDRDVIFLHRLQQRRLRARAGAVDLVGHQQLREDRAGDEAEGALAEFVLLHHLGAENVGRHQVGRELDAAGIEAEHDAERLDQLGLGKARHADQQRMAAGEQRHQRALDHAFLAEDDAADALRGSCEMSASAFSASAIISFSLIAASLIITLMPHRSSYLSGMPAGSFPAPRFGTMAACALHELKSLAPADKRNNSDYFVTMADSRAYPSESGLTGAGDAAGLSALISRAARAGKGLPPVERWNPDFCGDLDMEIRADGTWFYLGTPIGRMPLVQLFSTVLRKDADGKTYLVTPVEKVGIRVVDAPFVAVEMNVSGEGDDQVITFRTNVGDVVEAGPEHPLRFVDEDETGGLKPYVLVRGRLEALVARPVMYELVEHGEEIEIGGKTMFAVRSRGEVYPIMPAERLKRLSA